MAAHVLDTGASIAAGRRLQIGAAMLAAIIFIDALAVLLPGL